MADGFVQVAPDSTGKKVDNTELTVGSNLVERQRVQVSGAGAAELADVRNATPGGTDYGVVVRTPALPLPAGASTEATLANVLQEGADITGAAMPAGGSHARGWLSAIWKLLNGGLPAALGSGGGLKIDGSGTALPVSQSGSPWGVNPTAETAGVGVGAAADAAATGNGSAIGVLKQLRTLLAGGLPAALGAGGGVKVDGSGTALPVTANQGTAAAQANRWPVFWSDGTAERVIALPANASGAAALPHMQAYRKATYTVDADAITTGALTAATDKQLLSIEHAATSTKTVRIKKIVLNAVITTAGVAAGGIKFRIFTGTAASSAGTAVTPTQNNQRQGAAEVTAKTLPTIVAATGPKCTHGTWAPAAAGPLSETIEIVLYQWVPGETEELALRAGVLESLVIVVQAVSTPTLTVYITIELTEE